MPPNVPPFMATPADIKDLGAQLQHQLTMLGTGRKRETKDTHGVTVWSTPAKELVLFWDWSLTAQAIAQLTNPLEIRSNLVFVRSGKVLDAPDQRVWISELVSVLPWQKWVKAHLLNLAVSREPRKALTSDSRRIGGGRAAAREPSPAMAFR